MWRRSSVEASGKSVRANAATKSSMLAASPARSRASKPARGRPRAWRSAAPARTPSSTSADLSSSRASRQRSCIRTPSVPTLTSGRPSTRLAAVWSRSVTTRTISSSNSPKGANRTSARLRTGPMPASSSDHGGSSEPLVARVWNSASAGQPPQRSTTAMSTRRSSANRASSCLSKARSDSPRITTSPVTRRRANGNGGRTRPARTRWPFAGSAPASAAMKAAPVDPSPRRWTSSRTRATSWGARAQTASTMAPSPSLPATAWSSATSRPAASTDSASSVGAQPSQTSMPRGSTSFAARDWTRRVDLPKPAEATTSVRRRSNRPSMRARRRGRSIGGGPLDLGGWSGDDRPGPLLRTRVDTGSRLLSSTARVEQTLETLPRAGGAGTTACRDQFP